MYKLWELWLVAVIYRAIFTSAAVHKNSRLLFHCICIFFHFLSNFPPLALIRYSVHAILHSLVSYPIQPQARLKGLKV